MKFMDCSKRKGKDKDKDISAMFSWLFTEQPWNYAWNSDVIREMLYSTSQTPSFFLGKGTFTMKLNKSIKECEYYNLNLACKRRNMKLDSII